MRWTPFGYQHGCVPLLARTHRGYVHADDIGTGYNWRYVVKTYGEGYGNGMLYGFGGDGVGSDSNDGDCVLRDGPSLWEWSS